MLRYLRAFDEALFVIFIGAWIVMYRVAHVVFVLFVVVLIVSGILDIALQGELFK